MSRRVVLKLQPAAAAAAAALCVAVGYLFGSARARRKFLRSWLPYGSTWSAEKAAMGMRLTVDLKSIRDNGWSEEEVAGFQQEHPEFIYGGSAVSQKVLLPGSFIDELPPRRVLSV